MTPAQIKTAMVELRAQVDELSRASADIADLLKSAQIATVFLDRNLNVRTFTPAALNKPLEDERLVGTLAAACARGKRQ